MTKETITRIKLTATDGMVLTNGEALAKEVYLGTADAPENWREITEEEAAAIQEEREHEVRDDVEPDIAEGE